MQRSLEVPVPAMEDVNGYQKKLGDRHCDAILELVAELVAELMVERVTGRAVAGTWERQVEVDGRWLWRM